MFARFTSEAGEAMVLAREESGRLRHPWAGTEHLLLALLRQQGTRAGSALANLGVTSASVEHQLIAELGEPSPEQPLGDSDEEALRGVGIDLPEVRRRVEAVAGHWFIATDHLLLGMTEVRGGLAMSLLGKLGVSAGMIRETLEA